MNDKIYLIQNDDSLHPMEKQPYLNEDLLQTLLEHYPELLAGEQIDEVEPRRWLLIDREVSFPEADDGGHRMSLDHLFLDQDGIPTLVEVKRSSDTRIRREVVGQMLDYAANAISFWPVEYIRARFEAAHEQSGSDPDQILASFLDTEDYDEEQIEAFWGQVKTNLQARKLRLVFVADQIPAQLRRIVEFLNEQMDPAEVLAVELRQYVGQGIKTIVPRVIGLTADAEQKKGRAKREKRQWDEDSFFTELGKNEPTAVPVARKILTWARKTVTYVYWGQGKVTGSFVPVFEYNGIRYQLFAVWTKGKFELYIAWFRHKPPFDVLERRLEMVDRLNQIEGLSLPEDAVHRQPTILLTDLINNEILDQILTVFEWIIAEIKKESEGLV